MNACSHAGTCLPSSRVCYGFISEGQAPGAGVQEDTTPPPLRVAYLVQIQVLCASTLALSCPERQGQYNASAAESRLSCPNTSALCINLGPFVSRKAGKSNAQEKISSIPRSFSFRRQCEWDAGVHDCPLPHASCRSLANTSLSSANNWPFFKTEFDSWSKAAYMSATVSASLFHTYIGQAKMTAFDGLRVYAVHVLIFRACLCKYENNECTHTHFLRRHLRAVGGHVAVPRRVYRRRKSRGPFQWPSLQSTE